MWERYARRYTLSSRRRRRVRLSWGTLLLTSDIKWMIHIRSGKIRNLYRWRRASAIIELPLSKWYAHKDTTKHQLFSKHLVKKQGWTVRLYISQWFCNIHLTTHENFRAFDNFVKRVYRTYWLWANSIWYLLHSSTPNKKNEKENYFLQEKD